MYPRAQTMPQIPTRTLPSKLPSLPAVKLGPVSRSFRRGLAVLKASCSATVEGDSVSVLQRCYEGPSSAGSSDSMPQYNSSCLVMSAPLMKAEFGFQRAVTLDKKSNIELPQKKTRPSRSPPPPELDVGGSGGDIGKIIHNGGGDGGDDDDDEDDYFDDFDDGDEGEEGGLFRRRMLFEEIFDRKFVDSVLNEWQKTMMDLPAGLRQAYEMGLVSSAQMVRFLVMNARPTTSRFISRTLPQGWSRAFIGRMIADPTFLYKFLLEQAATIGCSLWWEVKNREERFCNRPKAYLMCYFWNVWIFSNYLFHCRIKQEWDLALINVVTAAACNAVVVWSLAPCRSYGNTFQFDLQNTLQKLPNNIFEKSYPFREFDLGKRIHSFFFKAAELCMVGLTAGAIQGGVSSALLKRKDGRSSVTVPSVNSNALGYGAFLGLYANLRYQLLCGVDRAMINHFDVLGVSLFFSTALRVLNVQLGETSRRAWLGVEANPLFESDHLLKVYDRPSEEVDNSSSKWFISKNSIVSGLGLLGIKQGNTDSVADAESPAPKARRKRIVRKKVAAGSA